MRHLASFALPKNRRSWLVLASIVFVLIAAAFAARETILGRTPANLVEDFASKNGFEFANIHLSIPALPARSFSTSEGLLAWQDSQRARLEQSFNLRNRPALKLHDQQAVFPAGRTKLPAPAGLVRERLQFSASDGTRIPAILQYPEGGKPRPAILVIAGHVPSNDSGLRQLVWGSDSEHHSAATVLAQHGFVTLAFELRGFGLLGAREGAEHNAVARNALLQGTFYKALVTDDARRALALLRSLPHVDTGRIGVAGTSLGGEIAATLGALDPTINAVAISSYSGEAGLIDPAAVPDSVIIHHCHLIPGAWAFLRREDITLMLAPRPTLVVRGGRDYRFDHQFAISANEAWGVTRAADRFKLKIIENGAHVFFVKETAEFFLQTFGTP